MMISFKIWILCVVKTRFKEQKEFSVVLTHGKIRSQQDITKGRAKHALFNDE